MKSTLSDKKSRFKKNKTAVKFAAKFAKGDVLEIGSRDGFAVQYFNKLGHRAMGVEIDKDWTEYAQDMGRNVICGDFMKVDIDKKFNLIYARHSLEHFKEPLKVLEKCQSLLNSHGVIVIFLPLQDEQHSSSRTHLSFFPTLEHLKDMVELAGFTVKLCDYSKKHGLIAKSDEAVCVAQS